MDTRAAAQENGLFKGGKEPETCQNVHKKITYDHGSPKIILTPPSEPTFPEFAKLGHPYSKFGPKKLRSNTFGVSDFD